MSHIPPDGPRARSDVRTRRSLPPGPSQSPTASLRRAVGLSRRCRARRVAPPPGPPPRPAMARTHAWPVVWAGGRWPGAGPASGDVVWRRPGPVAPLAGSDPKLASSASRADRDVSLSAGEAGAAGYAWPNGRVLPPELRSQCRLTRSFVLLIIIPVTVPRLPNPGPRRPGPWPAP